MEAYQLVCFIACIVTEDLILPESRFRSFIVLANILTRHQGLDLLKVEQRPHPLAGKTILLNIGRYYLMKDGDKKKGYVRYFHIN